MTHDQWTDRLSDYLDGDMPAGERTALEAHLTDCAACRATAAELRRVVARAHALEDRPPAADLWPGIAERIGVSTGQHVVSLAARRERRRLVFSIPQALAAGITLMLFSSGVVWLALHAPTTTSTLVGPVAVAPNPSAGPSVRPIRNGWPAANTTYDAAVADLQRALEAGRSRLDTGTVRVIEQNLRIIDGAIAQARAALAADPGNAYLNLHLADTMRRKLELLRQANAIASVQS